MKKLILLFAILSFTLSLSNIVLGADTQSLVRFHENALFNAQGDPVAGNKNGAITLVEFFDYQCSHCVAMSPVIDAAIKNNPDLKVVYKLFSFGNPASTHAALAAFAAQKQGKFLAFHHALMNVDQPLNAAVIAHLAQSVDLNPLELQKAIDNRAIKNKLNANIKLAQALKMSGTPAFFIAPSNRAASNAASRMTFQMGELSETELQSAIDKARQ